MDKLAIGRTVTLRYCMKCGRFSSGHARTRCGSDARRNMRADCPTQIVDVCVVGLPGNRPNYGPGDKRQVPA